MKQLATTTQSDIQPSMDGAAIITAYLAQLDASDKTRATYERSLRQWAGYLETNGLTVMEATRRTVLAYKSELESTKKAATVNAYLSAVRGLYAYLEAEGIKPNVAASVKGVRRSQASPKDALTVAQARELLADKPGEGATLSELRDYAIINLLARRGLRTIEAVRANIGDVRQVNGEAVLYVQGKGYADKSDFVILNQACLAPLYAYLEARGCKDPEAPLFASHAHQNKGGRMSTYSISRIVKAAFKRHGIEAASLTAHSLRHTAVTLAQQGGASIQDVSRLVHHKHLDSTAIYDHSRVSERRAVEALDSIFDEVIA